MRAVRHHRASAANEKPGQRISDPAFAMVLPAGFEPAHPAPEAGALSPELREQRKKRLSAFPTTPYRPNLSGHIPRKPRGTPFAGVSFAAVSEALGRVLVVDDDEVIRQLIAVNLTLEGFEVETATDGQDCLERVLDVRPDVITLDVMMPHLDGWMTATRLRMDDETRHIKVVLITARAQDDDKRRGFGIGVDAYLTKPFDPAELIRIVRELAAASQGRGQKAL